MKPNSSNTNYPEEWGSDLLSRIQKAPALQRARRERQLLLSVLGSREGQELLTQLEARFETQLPAFQGQAGQYDALDAMRRDAHREVFLTLRHLLELARQEATNTPDTTT